MLRAQLLAKHAADPLLEECITIQQSAGTRFLAALASYEREMSQRAEAKVIASREAAVFYHSVAGDGGCV